MHSCYTSCSPTNSSLLWSVLLFFGIHGFQNRQVWGRLTLCRRLRHQCSFEDRKAWSRSNTNLLQFPDLKRRTTRFPFALLLFTWFRGNFISLRNYVPGFHYLGKKHLPLACGRVSYMTQEKSLKSQFCCSITAAHTPHCLCCWGTSNYMANGPRISCVFYVAFCMARHMTSIPSGMEENLPPLCSLSSRRGAVQSCKVLTTFSSSWGWWKLWALGSTETWLALHEVHGKETNPSQLCSQNLQLRLLQIQIWFFFTLNFTLLSNFHWKSVLQEKLQVSHAFGIGTINWHRLWILWRVPEEILGWHAAKGCRDCQSADLIFAQKVSKHHC